MTFLGCDTQALRSWGQTGSQARTRFQQLSDELRNAVESAAWAGPDRDAFIDRFAQLVDRPMVDALDALTRCVEQAGADADEQDRTSDVDGAGDDAAPGGASDTERGDRNGSSPGQTKKSGPPVDVPDDVKNQIDDPAKIRESAFKTKQGSMGDCFFLASLAAVAETNPEFIEKNIWFSDGKYHVRLYDESLWSGPHATVVDVDPKVAQNGVRDDKGNITWMSVYEAAYAQHKGGYGNIENGGFANDALPTITGQPTCTTDDEPSFSSIRDELEKGNIVVADTAKKGGDDGGWWDVINNDDGPVPSDTVSEHQYVVKGFTPDGKIIMQNPWGPEGGLAEGDPIHKPGTLILTEDEYRARFENVTLTQDPDTTSAKRPYVYDR